MPPPLIAVASTLATDTDSYAAGLRDAGFGVAPIFTKHYGHATKLIHYLRPAALVVRVAAEEQPSDLITEVRQLFTEEALPIIVLTASGESSHRPLIDAGASEIVAMSATSEDLASVLWRHLRPRFR